MPHIREIEDFDKFKTDLRCLFKVAKYQDDGDKLDSVIENNLIYKDISEEMSDAIEKITKVAIKSEYKEGGKVDMCKAWEDNRLKGVEQGREEVREEKVQIVINMLNKGYSENDLISFGFKQAEIDAAHKSRC